MTRCVRMPFFASDLKSSKVMPVCSRIQAWNFSGSAILLSSWMPPMYLVTSASTLMLSSLPRWMRRRLSMRSRRRSFSPCFIASATCWGVRPRWRRLASISRRARFRSVRVMISPFTLATICSTVMVSAAGSNAGMHIAREMARQMDRTQILILPLWLRRATGRRGARRANSAISAPSTWRRGRTTGRLRPFVAAGGGGWGPGKAP